MLSILYMPTVFVSLVLLPASENGPSLPCLYPRYSLAATCPQSSAPTGTYKRLSRVTFVCPFFSFCPCLLSSPCPSFVVFSRPCARRTGQLHHTPDRQLFFFCCQLLVCLSPFGLSRLCAGPERVWVLAHPLPRGDPALPALVAIPIVRLRDNESPGGDLCSSQFVAETAGAHAGEVYGAAVSDGGSVPRIVVPMALLCVERRKDKMCV